MTMPSNHADPSRKKADGRGFSKGIWSGALLVHFNLQMRLSRRN
jgi:hypothetical protein